MSRVLLSEAAGQDRRAITEYTVQGFGVQQARRLRDRFETALNVLAESPLLGRRRVELDPPDHTFRYLVVMKSFIIVYEPAEDGIRVARLLHGARNLAAELERDAGNEA
jgi:toxin ParE1/3/4